MNGIVVEEIAFKGFSSQINDIFGNKSKADVGRVYQSMIDAMLALTAFPLIPYTVEAEGRYRSLKSVLGSRLKKMDGRIAAHALHLDYVLVTQNIRDFQHIPGI